MEKFWILEFLAYSLDQRKQTMLSQPLKSISINFCQAKTNFVLKKSFELSLGSNNRSSEIVLIFFLDANSTHIFRIRTSCRSSGARCSKGLGIGTAKSSLGSLAMYATYAYICDAPTPRSVLESETSLKSF